MQNKTTLLIYNPRAGKNRTRPKPETLIKALGPSASSVHLAVTAYPGHAREIASTEGNRYRTVICCGGDGTLNEVTSGLPQSGPRPAVGYIPIGSTNDLASNVGIPSDVQGAAELIGSGLTHGYDIGSFKKRQSLPSGLPASAADREWSAAIRRTHFGSLSCSFCQ